MFTVCVCGGPAVLVSSRVAQHVPSPRPELSVCPTPGGGKSSGPTPASYRSTSAIDLQAAQRARARAQYAAAQRMRVGSGVSLREYRTDTLILTLMR